MADGIDTALQLLGPSGVRTPKPDNIGSALALLQSAPSPVSSDPNAKYKALSVVPKSDPTEGMTGTQKFLAGAGKAFVDVGRGAGQIAGVIPQSDIDESRRLDAPLMHTGAGVAGNIGGNMALFAPTAFVPGANTYTGAAVLGAGMGALQPTATGESRALNTGLGAGAGVAGQAAGRALSRALQPVQSTLPAEEAALATAAQREGIPLRASQVTGSRPLAITESVLENLPFTSSSQIAGKQAQKEAFQRAVLSRAGIEGASATPEVLAAQKAAIGGELGGIAERGTLDFNKGLTDSLSGIVDDAAKHLPPAKASQIAEQVDQILSQVDKSGAMAGSNYQGWRDPLRALAKKGDEFASYYGDIRKALDTAFRDQLPGAEGDAFRDLSRKYANLKTIAAAMGGSGADTAIGNIQPAALSQALSGSIGREGKALGRGDLNELARVGRRFISPSIPDSGTAQRQMIQALLTGNIPGAAAGAGLGYYEGRTPESALLGAGAGLAGTMVLPKLVQAAMNSPAGQAYLTRGAIPLGESGRAALAAALRTGAIGTVPSLATRQ